MLEGRLRLESAQLGPSEGPSRAPVRAELDEERAQRIGLEVDIAAPQGGKGVNEELDAAVLVDGVLKAREPGPDPGFFDVETDIEEFGRVTEPSLHKGFIAVAEPEVVPDLKSPQPIPCRGRGPHGKIPSDTGQFVDGLH